MPTLDLVAIDKSWVDVILSVPALPGHDQKILATPLGKQPGGSGGNVACAASRLGLRAGMVSWVGSDADGRLVLDDLSRFGVETGHIFVEPAMTTNYTTVLIDPSGEKAILIVPTSFDRLELTPTLTTYLSSTRLVFTTPYDPDQVVRVARTVHAADGLVCTDVEPVAGLPEETLATLLAQVDIAFFNAEILPTDDYTQAARQFAAAGPRLVVITCGARGAYASTGRDTVYCPAFPVPVVDTTGAGDCFNAACLAAYLRGLDLPAALRYAHAAAALSIQAYGARGALPTDAEVRAFMVLKHET